MRSLSITALMIVAAFVLGLALGGQAPREAAAQDELPEVRWKSDGETLVLSNQTTNQGFLVRGSYLSGANSELPPAFVDGILEVSQQDLDGIVISRIEPLFACDHISCRPCDEMPVLCEMPPRPLPVDETAILSVMGRIR